MKIKIDVDDERGGCVPRYSKDMDAGADVFAPQDVTIISGSTEKICLEISVHIPNGYVGFIMPRSGNATKGLYVAPVPIDPSYTGKIHAIVTNHAKFACNINRGDRIAQLVIMPFVRADFVAGDLQVRGDAGFGSTGGNVK